MRNEPIKPTPGCDCGFVDGYHSWHLPTCALVRAGKPCDCVGYKWQHRWGCEVAPKHKKGR